MGSIITAIHHGDRSLSIRLQLLKTAGLLSAVYKGNNSIKQTTQYYWTTYLDNSPYSGQVGFDQPTDIGGFVVPQIWQSPVIKTRRRQTHEFYISNQWSRWTWKQLLSGTLQSCRQIFYSHEVVLVLYAQASISQQECLLSNLMLRCACSRCFELITLHITGKHIV